MSSCAATVDLMSDHLSPMDAFFAQVVSNIEEYGTHVTGVGAGDGQPPFAYTTGLARVDAHPEFVIYGLDPSTAQTLLNNLSKTVLDGTERYAHGDWVDRLLAKSTPVRLIAVDDSSIDLTVSNALFRDQGDPPVAALQVVFPDKFGLWPWEDGSLVANLPAQGQVPAADDEGARHILPVKVG